MRKFHLIAQSEERTSSNSNICSDDLTKKDYYLNEYFLKFDHTFNANHVTDLIMKYCREDEANGDFNALLETENGPINAGIK